MSEMRHDFEVRSVSKKGTRTIILHLYDSDTLNTYQVSAQMNARREVKVDSAVGYHAYSDLMEERAEDAKLAAISALTNRGFRVVTPDEWLPAPWLAERGVSQSSMEGIDDYLDQMSPGHLEEIRDYCDELLGDGDE